MQSSDWSGDARTPCERPSESNDRLSGSERMVDGSDGERQRDDPSISPGTSGSPCARLGVGVGWGGGVALWLAVLRGALGRVNLVRWSWT